MAQLYLRVNGIDITNVRLRRKMADGLPIGERELVIEDPILGKFAIDNSFILEVTFDRRKKWKTVTVPELITTLVDTLQKCQ
jgi:hypothetical protein